jgi:hypothetical protein
VLSNYINNFKKKSLKERFLLVIGILFFILYLVFGLAIMFWEKLPLDMPNHYKKALGIILIVYAFLRFLRFFNKDRIQND